MDVLDGKNQLIQRRSGRPPVPLQKRTGSSCIYINIYIYISYSYINKPEQNSGTKRSAKWLDLFLLILCTILGFVCT